jgi:serine/threonine protein kinase
LVRTSIATAHRITHFRVTELYEGEKKCLAVQERLVLFIQVCEGVQHAHQKAIMHRDLKPSNILVVEVDGKPMPRIIDFGIAKAIARQGEILDRASAQFDTGLGQDPRLQARLMQTMGITYRGLGLYEQARTLLEHAVRIQTQTLGPDNPETLRSLAVLGGVVKAQGGFADSEKLLRRAITLFEKLMPYASKAEGTAMMDAHYQYAAELSILWPEGPSLRTFAGSGETRIREHESTDH